MFGVYWFSANGDITYLICHVDSQEHVIEGWYDVMGPIYSFYVLFNSSLALPPASDT